MCRWAASLTSDVPSTPNPGAGAPGTASSPPRPEGGRMATRDDGWARSGGGGAGVRAAGTGDGLGTGGRGLVEPGVPAGCGRSPLRGQGDAQPVGRAALAG